MELFLRMQIRVVLTLLSVGLVYGKNRTYYIAAQDVEWDYGPSKQDKVNASVNLQDIFLKNSADRIGGVYDKTVYKQYTDATYAEEVPKPGWMGILGPVIKGEVEDILVIHFLNNASRPYSMHPHGVHYSKNSEGAVYNDRTMGRDKVDDAVPAHGGRHTYIWEITDSHAPTDSDPNCIIWAYHSHTMSMPDTNAGLIGPLLTCKRGTLEADGTRTDGVQDIFLLLKVFDESMSWHFSNNMKRCGDEAACIAHDENGDDDFALSNELHSINAMLYANLPPFEVCANTRVAVHAFSIGSEPDLHVLRIKGQTMVFHDQRSVTIPLFAATFKTAEIIPTVPGRWLVDCEANEHYDTGMLAFLDVMDCGKPAITETNTTVENERVYYISAEEAEWDYGPSGRDLFNDVPLDTLPGPQGEHFTKTMNRIGGKYLKVLFVEYTDASFTVKKPRTGTDIHLGLLGPVMRVEVGEQLTVVFQNMANRSYSFSADGVFTDKANEGTKYNDGTNGTAGVEPGANRTYTWTIPEAFAPTKYDMDCNTYIYHSGVSQARDTSTGLLGALLVCKRGTLDANGQQRNADKEFVLLAFVVPESLSWKYEENIQKYPADPATVNRNDEGFAEATEMGGFNGLMFGNIRGLEACIGDRISWHIIGAGSDADNHPIYFRGNSLTTGYHNGDTFAVFPGTSSTAMMVPDNPGIWAISCASTGHHVNAGITALYKISTCGRMEPQYTGKIRRYYIAVEEVMWDYHPDKNRYAVDPDASNPFMPPPAETTLFKKAVFREYTDQSFTTAKQRGKNDEHLGIQGPTIFAEVGDTVIIVLMNMGSRPYSLHSHGVMFTKENEGEVYKDDYFTNSGDAVPAGGRYTYQWNIPSRTGPGDSDPNCIPYPYYSATDPVRDIASGLIGTTVICRKDTLSDGNVYERRDGVDRQFSVLFFVFEETESWYFEENVARINPDKATFDDSVITSFYTINGFSFAQDTGLVMYRDEKVAWYVVGLGSEFAIHTVHFHGQTLIHRHNKPHRLDVVLVLPGIAETVVMTADNPGTWLLHCHVDHHVVNGMMTTFLIMPTNDVEATTSIITTTEGQSGGGKQLHMGLSLILVLIWLCSYGVIR